MNWKDVFFAIPIAVIVVLGTLGAIKLTIETQGVYLLVVIAFWWVVAACRYFYKQMRVQQNDR